MNQRTKILIAYDGSSCADAALDDLRRAGLPLEAEAAVISVAEVWLPPLPPSGHRLILSAFTKPIPAAVQETHAHAQTASQRIQKHFPAWDVRAEAYAGSPASVVLARADEWGADLIVAGSHGRAALGRFLLGSVSQKIMTEARCSVRIARGRHAENDAPVRVIIGVDGSRGAESAVRAVAARVWPPGSEVRGEQYEFLADLVNSALIANYLRGQSQRKEPATL
jgi:nucleotide-binding universal stress UspA family protein